MGPMADPKKIPTFIIPQFEGHYSQKDFRLYYNSVSLWGESKLHTGFKFLSNALVSSRNWLVDSTNGKPEAKYECISKFHLIMLVPDLETTEVFLATFNRSLIYKIQEYPRQEVTRSVILE